MCGDLARIVVKMLNARRCANPVPGSRGVSIHVW